MNATDLIAQAEAMTVYSQAETRLRKDARYAADHDAPASAQRLWAYADRVHRALIAEHVDLPPDRLQ